MSLDSPGRGLEKPRGLARGREGLELTLKEAEAAAVSMGSLEAGQQN